MITDHPMHRQFTLHTNLSMLAYVGLIIILCLTTLLLLMDIAEKYSARNDSLEILTRLEERTKVSPQEPGGIAASSPPGSPFLESQTVTLARAALLQRIISAITSAGGSVMTSEIEAQGSNSKDNYLRAIATCEIEQPALQKLLYDIEAGMPFLFVDQLVAQAPMSPSEGKRMRVLLGVSGLWPGAK